MFKSKGVGDKKDSAWFQPKLRKWHTTTNFKAENNWKEFVFIGLSLSKMDNFSKQDWTYLQVWHKFSLKKYFFTIGTPCFWKWKARKYWKIQNKSKILRSKSKSQNSKILLSSHVGSKCVLHQAFLWFVFLVQVCDWCYRWDN